MKALPASLLLLRTVIYKCVGLNCCTNPTCPIMLTDHGVLLFGSLLLFLFFVHSTLRVKRDWRAFGRLPAYSILVSPLHAVNRILPYIPGISYGAEWSWMNVYEPRPLRSAHRPSCLDVFAASKSDIVQIRSLFPFGVPQLVTADATAVKVGPEAGREAVVFVLNFSV